MQSAEVGGKCQMPNVKWQMNDKSKVKTQKSKGIRTVSPESEVWKQRQKP